ncbi:Hypothetical predicted protein [Paramuricea clavata]|uniref:Uncharacterized protein n=2 Tax=Paramuricea clavata TaxID=317549 RepID=A0A6S7HRV8_PARCT|nr:Hypothetical predicted protein [Paramuricea clavata]
MMKVVLATLFLLIHIICIKAGTNFDAKWTRTCSKGYSISRVSSLHSNRHEDRSWSFRCRHNSKITSSCKWSGWVNWFDREILYQCRNGVIAGWHSYHSNRHEDRRFQFKCCRTKKNCVRNCVWTGYVNNWDAYINYGVPRGYFLTGTKSYHHNGHEDRRWRFLICKLG